MFGRLTLDAFKHGPIEMGASISMGVISFIVIALLFYFKRWKWLWKEWLTSVDPKKI